MYKDAYIITVDKGNILEATPDTYQRIMYKCVLMSSQDGILYSSQDECTTAALIDRNTVSTKYGIKMCQKIIYN